MNNDGTIVFGESTDNTAVPHSYMGMSGYWQLPPSGLYCRPLAGATNNLECFENADFTGKRYIASMDYDGTFVFCDTLANKFTGNE